MSLPYRTRRRIQHISAVTLAVVLVLVVTWLWRKNRLQPLRP